jgi:hypothetical protein
MIRSAFLIAITGFWITMMSFLVHRQYFQLSAIQSPHEILAFDYMDMREEYRAIYLGKERIGFSHFVLDPLKKSLPDRQAGKKDFYELRHSTYMSFLFLGVEREMLIKGRARLNEQLRLRAFEIKISSGDSWTRLTGKISGKTMNLVIRSSEGAPLRKILPMKSSVIYSEAMGFLWSPENLRIGKRARIEIWNPLAMTFQDAEFWVREKQKIETDYGLKETYLVHLTLAGVETRTWISMEGVVLKEESAAGLTLQKEDAYKIFDGMREKRSAPPDLPNFFSVPSDKILENPAALNYLKVKIEYGEEERIFEIRKPAPGSLTDSPLTAPRPDLLPYLASDAWVQADDPVMIETAKEIAGGARTVLTASAKIQDWVHRHVSPVPTVSLPVSREVLQFRKGDCNEYTVLFTALARALKIPVKMVAGLVYLNGRFFYHAWPEVYTGEWVALDPTFGQFPADVTHIPLVEGGLEEQMALTAQIGKLKAVIIEAG